MERYESLGPVGEGSYGIVLKCRHRDSGRLVAIKKFLDSDQDKTVKKIALREVKLLRQLRHDNLVNLLEVWKRRHRWYLVFEFVDRTLLEDLEQNPNGLDLSTCRTYLFQVLRAVDFCHQQNVIHRDIKPENILVSQDGVAKLCDFGFARTILSPSEGGVYTDYVATRWYRAPELLVGDIKYGKPVDVWALGCLVIEMLTGQPLFPGDSDLDQIFHIVRCFGDLMTLHQEVFYRNPVFSGVNLPECSSTISLHQRFPQIPPNALHLAQRCLEMDPEKRAQCSELLQHPLFTQDSFHIRLLDDLNAKIQKEHRENSTLPQITKIPRLDTDKGDEKNCQGKDKKQPEDTDERVNKDKIDKTKGKQLSKLSKTNRNTTESLLSTQPKTFGNKIIHNTTQYPTKTKSEKPTGAEIKNESEASKTTKTFISKPPDETEAEVTLKKKNLTTKSKQESVTPPEPKKDLPQNTEDMNCCGPDPEKNTGLCKPEPTQEFPTSWSNPTMKVLNVAKPYKTSPVAEFQFDQQEDASKSPKVLPKNQKITTNSSPKPNTNILNSSSKTFPLHLSEQPSTETTSTHNTAAVPKELSSLKISKVEFTSRALSKDRELIDKKEFRSCHGYLNPVTEIPEGVVLLSQTSDGSFKSSAGQNTKVAKDDRFTLNLVGTTVLKVTNNSEKGNQEDLASHLVPISSTNQPVKPTLKASGNSGPSESDADSFKVPHPKQSPLKTHQHTRSSVIPKTQKLTPAPDAKKKSDRNVLTTSRDSTLSLTLDHKASTEGFKTNISDLSAPRASTPSPPPSSSNPLLLPTSSQLMSSLSIFNNPAAGDYLVQGAGFNPGTNSLRCVDYSGTRDRPTQQFAASKLTGSFTVLVSENSFISEMAKNKSHVHFPDIRSSTLPELREKEGKHNKGAIKNLRKDKNLVSFSPPSEGQGHKSYTSTTKL